MKTRNAAALAALITTAPVQADYFSMEFRGGGNRSNDIGPVAVSNGQLGEAAFQFIWRPGEKERFGHGIELAMGLSAGNDLQIPFAPDPEMEIAHVTTAYRVEWHATSWLAFAPSVGFGIGVSPEFPEDIAPAASAAMGVILYPAPRKIGLGFTLNAGVRGYKLDADTNLVQQYATAGIRWRFE